jgi:hypothetical protein
MNNTPVLYVLLDEDNKFVTGGGSSTSPFIRVYDNLDSAKRGLRYFSFARIVPYGQINQGE